MSFMGFICPNRRIWHLLIISTMFVLLFAVSIGLITKIIIFPVRAEPYQSNARISFFISEPNIVKTSAPSKLLSSSNPKATGFSVLEPFKINITKESTAVVYNPTLISKNIFKNILLLFSVIALLLTNLLIMSRLFRRLR